jgi:hypothetical protein
MFPLEAERGFTSPFDFREKARFGRTAARKAAVRHRLLDGALAYDHWERSRLQPQRSEAGSLSSVSFNGRSRLTVSSDRWARPLKIEQQETPFYCGLYRWLTYFRGFLLTFRGFLLASIIASASRLPMLRTLAMSGNWIRRGVVVWVSQL